MPHGDRISTEGDKSLSSNYETNAIVQLAQDAWSKGSEIVSEHPVIFGTAAALAVAGAYVAIRKPQFAMEALSYLKGEARLTAAPSIHVSDLSRSLLGLGSDMTAEARAMARVTQEASVTGGAYNPLRYRRLLMAERMRDLSRSMKS